MKPNNHDGNTGKAKRPASPESREKRSKAKKEWWAKKRQAQADNPTVPVQDATVTANEPSVPDSATKEPYSSVSHNPVVERGHGEAPATGDGGAGSPASDGNQGAPSGKRAAAKPLSDKQYAANVRNSRRSTGPRTAAGKQKSSLNAYKEGFYAKHLFPTTVEWQRDGSVPKAVEK